MAYWLDHGARRMGATSAAPFIILLFCIGWILNGAMGAPAPGPVIDRDNKDTEVDSRNYKKEDTALVRDKPKTDFIGGNWTDNGNAPVFQLPEFVIDELNEEGNNSMDVTKENFSQGHLDTGLEYEYQPGLVIRCSGKGTPRPNVTWIYNGGNLPQYVEMTGLTFSQNQTEGTKEEQDKLVWVDLTLPKLNNAFYGRLQCVVQNSFGNVSWTIDLVPNGNSSIFMKIVRCTFAAIFMLVGILLIKTVVWFDFKRKEKLYEKLPPQDQEIIQKFRKGLPPPPTSPSSSIVPTGINCVAAAIEIIVTSDGNGTANSPLKYGYRLVKHGSSSPDLEKRFLRNGGASSPTSCLSVHVLDSVNSWTNYVAYDDKLETSSQHFKVDLTKTIENGVYGMTFLGQVRNDLTMEWSTVAVKTGKSERDDNFMLESMLTELKILASLPKAHKHIVNLRGAYTKQLHNRQAYVFVDYCENGPLAEFIDLNRNHFHDLFVEPAAALRKNSCDARSIPTDEGLVMKTKPFPVNPNPKHAANVREENSNKPIVKFSTKELIAWAWQIADGMNFLHKNRIIHGNLSTANIYVTKGLKIKIGNIGYPPAEQSLECIDSTTKKWLTIPEYNFEHFSKNSDVWDYGRSLWEIFSLRGQQCPDAKDIVEFLSSTGGEIEMPDYATSEIFEIILFCWNDDGTLRPEFDVFAKVFKNLLKAKFPTSPGGVVDSAKNGKAADHVAEK